MQNEPVSVRLELTIPAQQVLHHLRTYNAEIEEQVKAGVEAAIKDLAENKRLESLVRQKVQETLVKSITDSVCGYENMKNMRDIIMSKMIGQLDNYAHELISDVSEKLKLNLNK